MLLGKAIQRAFTTKVTRVTKHDLLGVTMEFEPVSGQIIRVALDVHSELGPGLLESAYRAFLCADLVALGLRVQKEVPLPITYHGVQLEIGYRIDLVVEDVVVEIKTVAKLLPVHEAQLLSYLRL